jgi:hypothetical protein
MCGRLGGLLQTYFYHNKSIVTYRPIARQRRGKHIPGKAKAPDNEKSIVRQGRGKHISSALSAQNFIKKYSAVRTAVESEGSS